ncbi:hypothetical protein BRADI_2g04003v3 [Brachypodium distachyon]|uniref:Uncharacterized protein n=1 Tax=Brachypodium distachyon TaxID=15368 RepID=A0A0Q3MEL4_BRADI|nr:hypothetical protein BRADI_2g04003v3 [Brachypodium distachyon]
MTQDIEPIARICWEAVRVDCYQHSALRIWNSSSNFLLILDCCPCHASSPLKIPVHASDKLLFLHKMLKEISSERLRTIIPFQVRYSWVLPLLLIFCVLCDSKFNQSLDLSFCKHNLLNI